MSDDGLKLHIVALKHKHHNLQLEINELVYTHGDELKIQELKKQKLRLKEEITQLETQING
jgi:hypothetical protein